MLKDLGTATEATKFDFVPGLDAIQGLGQN